MRGGARRGGWRGASASGGGRFIRGRVEGVKGGDASPLGSGGTVLDVMEGVEEHAAAGGGEGKVDADAVDEDARDVVDEGGRLDGAVEGVGVRGRVEGHVETLLQLVCPRGWGREREQDRRLGCETQQHHVRLAAPLVS
jgi:hypothetical protein